MRRTFTLLATTAALAAGITSSASAATLYTTAAHTTPVAVGTTFGAKLVSGTSYTVYNSVGAVVNICNPTYVLQVAQNSGGVFRANVTGRSLGCFVQNWGVLPGGALQISGSSTTVGTNKSWAATNLTGSVNVSGTTYTENFSGAGVSAQQPIAGGAPVSIVLNHAGTFSAPPPNVPLNVSGTYNLVATSGGPYSLG